MEPRILLAYRVPWLKLLTQKIIDLLKNFWMKKKLFDENQSAVAYLGRKMQ